MYVTRVEIRKLRSIRRLVWHVDAGDAPGWHVILGGNGSGKSTFVRAVSLPLVGVNEAAALAQDWNTWPQLPLEPLPGNNSDAPDVLVELDLNEEFDEISDIASTKFREVVVFFNGINSVGIQTTIPLGARLQDNGSLVESVTRPGRIQRGCFSASFGPFRRFTGGDSELGRLYETSPLLARHLTAFSESVALTEGISWLRELQFKRLEGDKISELVIDALTEFINQAGFLPYNVYLSHINSSGVHFRDGNGNTVPVELLGDGYRSILSLTLELIRQLSLTFGPQIFHDDGNGLIYVRVPGIVQIDEIDAHLHPTWQKRIGFWLCEHFPNIQFIVTTHSPLICQAAEKGTIYQLPAPGSDEQGRFLTGAERDRLIYGDILDAYSTEAFGTGVTRSEQSQKMLERLAELNVQELTVGLGDAERQEQQRLRAALPTTATVLPERTAP